MPPRIIFGVNLNFAKYVYSPRRALEIAKDALGVRHVEMVADNDFGPAFYLGRPESFRAHHREIAAAARELGVEIPSVLTIYRDSGAIAASNPEIRDSARQVGLSILEQAASYGAPYVGISFFTMNRDEAEDADRFERAYEAALEIWKGWMADARRLGIEFLLVEMAAARREACSTIADTRKTLEALEGHHRANPETTVPVGLCYDTGHGISRAESPDESDRDFRGWLAAFPGEIHEIHLKNTDSEFQSTWHFTAAGEAVTRGIIEPREVLRCVKETSTVPTLLLYLEVPGKRGRDIGERQAIDEHRQSIRKVVAALEAVGYRRDPEDGTWSCG